MVFIKKKNKKKYGLLREVDLFSQWPDKPCLIVSYNFTFIVQSLNIMCLMDMYNLVTEHYFCMGDIYPFPECVFMYPTK